MFLALSKFKVKNNMQDKVKSAFLSRPHLVDKVAGFQSMEVYTPTDDETEFWLLTRWTNESAFQKWHKSDAHNISHHGIPKGLKLEPKSTMVKYFKKVAD
jgi:heme oxygenase (mycobilin-producing)